MEIKAKLHVKYDTKSFGESGFLKREFVVEYAENPQYPEYPKFELTQDKCSLLDSIEVGQDITISLNICGRKWVNPKGEDVYFSSLKAWKLEAYVNSIGDAHPQRDANDAEVITSADGDTDDLPFALTLLIASSFLLQTLPI